MEGIELLNERRALLTKDESSVFVITEFNKRITISNFYLWIVKYYQAVS